MQTNKSSKKKSEKIDYIQKIWYNVRSDSIVDISAPCRKAPRRISEKMKTRIIALILCVVFIIPMFSGCSSEVVESQLQIYIAHQVYDLDPLNAFTNDANAKFITLLFSGLYKIDEKGKVTEDLVKKAEVNNDYDKKEYTLTLTLNDTCWSDGSAVQSADVLYTFHRVLKANKSNDAAALLFKVKNAEKVKNGDLSIDDLGVYSVDTKVIEIKFEEEITDDVLNEFKLNLTSPALFPLREINVEGKEDWAKKQTSMVFSGPFLLRKVSYADGNKHMILERNSYYYRNREKDKEDKYVTPFRLYINFEASATEQLALYNNGQVMFLGDIPLESRSTYEKTAEKQNTLSTHTYFFNQNAVITSSKGVETKLFSYPEVRQALSLSIDREAIKNMVVFAETATGLLPNSMFASNSRKETFRETFGNLSIGKNDAKVTELLTSLKEKGIDPKDYAFSITVRESDAVHVAIAEKVAEAWSALGFTVTVNPVGVMVNDEPDPVTNEIPQDIRDDLFDENVVNGGDYQVLAIDYVAKSANPLSMLAPFSIHYNGNKTLDGRDTVEILHSTGYRSEEYDALIKQAIESNDPDEAARYYSEAEKLLVETDAAVAPIIFNQSAVLINKDLKKLTVSYFGNYNFTKAKYKDWAAYNEVYFPETEEGGEAEQAPVEDKTSN